MQGCRFDRSLPGSRAKLPSSFVAPANGQFAYFARSAPPLPDGRILRASGQNSPTTTTPQIRLLRQCARLEQGAWKLLLLLLLSSSASEGNRHLGGTLAARFLSDAEQQQQQQLTCEPRDLDCDSYQHQRGGDSRRCRCHAGCMEDCSCVDTERMPFSSMLSPANLSCQGGALFGYVSLNPTLRHDNSLKVGEHHSMGNHLWEANYEHNHRFSSAANQMICRKVVHIPSPRSLHLVHTIHREPTTGECCHSPEPRRTRSTA